MALVDSLLTAMVRADGDALVMHVGERPYVVAQSRTIDVSTHGLNLSAMNGMLAQLLPVDARAALDELGAVEQTLPSRGSDRFTVVAARGGEDIWIEIRRRREARAVDIVDVEPAPAAPPAAETSEAPAATEAEPAAEAVPVSSAGPDADADAGTSADAAAEPTIELTDDAPPVSGAPLDTDTDADADFDADAGAARHEPAEDTPAMNGMPALEIDARADSTAGALEEDTMAIDESSSAGEPQVPEPVAAELTADLQAVAGAADAVTASSGDAAAASPPAPAMASGAVGAAHGDPPQTSRPSTHQADVPPVTRRVRIEVPPSRSGAPRAAGADRLLRAAAALGATELFVTPQAVPYVRVDGDIRPLDGEAALTAGEVEAVLLELAPETLREQARHGESGEWLAEMADIGRVRCASFRDQRGVGLLCRLTSTRAASLEQLGLGPEVQALATEPDGLVLVAGREGSGKSSIISALVDAINRRRADYVITLEPELRLLHENRHALISQREVAGGEALVAAARAALREAPDVLVIDGLDSAEMVDLVLGAAGRGLLVVASVPAASATDAVAHIVGLVPDDRRASVQASLAGLFRGAVSQVLVRKAAGGRVAARELLLASGDVTRVIASGSFVELPGALDAGRRYGMTSLTATLVEQVQGGVVDVREAWRKAPNRDTLVAGLKAAAVDTSLIDRLA